MYSLIYCIIIIHSGPFLCQVWWSEQQRFLNICG